MKRKQIILLAVTVAATVLLAVCPVEGGVLYLLALPLIAAGEGLRYLSLSGGLGNAVALVLYAVVCLSPLALKWKRKWCREDGLLVLSAGVMFYVMYGLINPGVLPAMLQTAVGRVQLSFLLYSVLAAWAILKLLRVSDRVRQENIYRALQIFLMICAVELVAVSAGLGLQELLAGCRNLRAENTWPGIDLVPTYIFLGLRYLATAVEYGLDTVVLLSGVKLLAELERDAYSEGCVAAGERTVLWCKRTLAVSALLTMALNLGQVVFAGVIYDAEVSLRLPVMSIAIAFGAMALTRLLVQGKTLKEDNELFI